MKKLNNIDQYVLTSETETNLSINVSLIFLDGFLTIEEIKKHLEGNF
jgi:hypothetical protein